MINQRITTNGESVIYVGGGNSVITQAFPTCYRTFHTAVTCNVDETDRWTEWTAEQRAAWEKNPPVPARRDWLTEALDSISSRGYYGDSDAIAVLNDSTGYYELNGLKDLTHDDMLEIYRCGIIHSSMNPGHLKGSSKIRTNMFLWVPGRAYGSYENCFYGCSNLEVANTPHIETNKMMFRYCGKLRTILPSACYDYNKVTGAFEGCLALEDIPATLKASGDWDLRWSPNLTTQTLTNLVTSCVQAGTEEKPNTLTLHPDAFARLTDGQKATAAERFISITTP